VICNVQGQPQCLRKVTTVGFPLEDERLSLVVVGAFSPTAGVVPSLPAAAPGDILHHLFSAVACLRQHAYHDQNSVENVIVVEKEVQER
jgi:hypothetical protein